MLALALAVGKRAPALVDDRAWFDEFYVFLESMGISFRDPWPARFVRADVDPSPEFSRVLDLLTREDAYPPLVHAITWSLHAVPNPLLAARAVFVLGGLALIGVVYVGARRLAGPGEAAVIAAYVACSPMLTDTGQELKWYALAPLLAAAATFLLLDLRAGERWRWALYAACLFLLAQTHYFCVWIIPAHALFAWWRRPELRLRFAAAYAIVLLACAPWLLWALPRQQEYVRHQFEVVFPAWPPNAWFQPASLKAITAAHLYTLLAMVGVEPSPVRARYLVPAAGLALWLLGRGWFALDPRRRDFVRASVATLGLAIAGQTLYALRLGQTIPLTATYYASWCPLVMIAVMLGALEVSDSRLRAALAAALIGVSVLNVAWLGPPRRALEPGSLSDYREVARALSEADRTSAIVFRSDRDAKMVNVFYDGPATQVIWAADGEPVVPADALRLVCVSATDAPAVRVPPGWTSVATPQVFGHTRLERLGRAVMPSP